MADMFSDYTISKGSPSLDKDYWKNQNKSVSEKSDMPNIFDDLIRTNFDVDNLKHLSVFKAKEK